MDVSTLVFVRIISLMWPECVTSRHAEWHVRGATRPLAGWHVSPSKYKHTHLHPLPHFISYFKKLGTHKHNSVPLVERHIKAFKETIKQQCEARHELDAAFADPKRPGSTQGGTTQCQTVFMSL